MARRVCCEAYYICEQQRDILVFLASDLLLISSWVQELLSDLEILLISTLLTCIGKRFVTKSFPSIS